MKDLGSRTLQVSVKKKILHIMCIKIIWGKDTSFGFVQDKELLFS